MPQPCGSKIELSFHNCLYFLKELFSEPSFDFCLFQPDLNIIIHEHMYTFVNELTSALVGQFCTLKIILCTVHGHIQFMHIYISLIQDSHIFRRYIEPFISQHFQFIPKSAPRRNTHTHTHTSDANTRFSNVKYNHLMFPTTKLYFV